MNTSIGSLKLVMKGVSSGGELIRIPKFLSDAVGIHEAIWLQGTLCAGIARHGYAPQNKADLAMFLMTDGEREDLTLEEADAYADVLLMKASEFLMEKEAAKKALKIARLSKRVENRIQYLNTPVFNFYNKNNIAEEDWGAGFRWKFDTEVRGCGLMDHISGMKELVTVPLLVDLSAPEGEEYVAEEAWSKALNRISEIGWACSKQKLLWNRNSDGWAMAVELFPNAVDLNAYNHGLNAPVVPGGYMDEVEVKLCNLKDNSGKLLDSDGSGRIHPLHPLFTQMGRPTAHYPIQIRFANRTRTFCKGILVPDDRCMDSNGKPEIWMDWKQVKGYNKKNAKNSREADKSVYTKGHLGVIQVWDTPSKIDWSFEQLENIQTNPQTKQIIGNRVAAAMKQMERGGIMGLAERVAKDSKVAMLALKVIASMNDMGLDVNPLQFPMMKSQILDRLGKQLWWISQGAGMQMDRYVAVQDQSVLPGHCVIRDFPEGTKIAAMRYPVVLTQGLSTLEVMAPNPHHLVAGEVVPFAIYMHPDDLTGCLMGDDDGDTVGVSADGDVVALWAQLIDDKRYAIEPIGEPIHLDPNSAEGLLYLSKDHRDDVGKLTIMRTKLLAVGDLRGAVAISCLIQEAIDRAKRVVVWTDWRLAADIRNWEEVNGTLKYKGPKIPGDLPIEEITKWTAIRTHKYGGLVKGEKASVIAWRSQFTKEGTARASKRVNPQTWKYCSDAGNWDGGNLVHHSNDTALAIWKDMEQRFLPKDSDQDISTLMMQALNLLEVEDDKGVVGADERYYPAMTWEDYQGYREQWGIQSFLGRLKTCLSKRDEADKLMSIDQLIEERASQMTQMTEAVGEFEVVARMELMWRMESSNDRSEGLGEGNLNAALYSICYTGSPLLTWLGIEQPKDGCPFLTSKRVQTVMDMCLTKDEPIKSLMSIIQNSTGHEQVIKDTDGEGIPGWCCQDCIDRLTLHLVRKLRAAKDTGLKTKSKELRFALQG